MFLHVTTTCMLKVYCMSVNMCLVILD